MVACIVDINRIVKSLSMVMFVGWKDVLIPSLVIGKKARSKEKGGLSIHWLCGNSQWRYFGMGTFHALQQSATESPLCILLPYFYKTSTTPAMIRYGLRIQRWTNEWLNPGQIPVTIFDQALFAMAKLAQWKWARCVRLLWWVPALTKVKETFLV